MYRTPGLDAPVQCVHVAITTRPNVPVLAELAADA
jgi:hypothetical protein